MRNNVQYIAIDIGAESGRVMAGFLDDDGIRLEEAHRFSTGAVRMLDSLYWDLPHFLREIRTGFRAFAGRYGTPEAIGVDSWGNGFGLLDKDGRLLANMIHYRDPRTEGVPEQFYRRMPPEKLYERTGVQMLRFNLLYQIHSLALAKDPLLEIADKMLMGGEIVSHYLAGHSPGEYTDVSTSQLYDVPRDAWAWDVAQAAGVPARILPEVVRPGTRIGRLLAHECDAAGFAGQPEVALPACHDTASAVAGIPAGRETDWLFISSGTWSLIGAELDRAIATPEAFAENFTNEGGVFGTYRFLKNIVGLWLLQEYARELAGAGQAADYAELSRNAEAAPPFRAIVDVNDPAFLDPGPMVPRIAAYCRRTGQRPPETPGETTRVILEGLALSYRRAAGTLERLTGRKYAVIHIVGGGCLNAPLNQMTADATGLVVKAGPAEATALGNIAMQAVAMERLSGLAEGREIIGKSFTARVFEPNPALAAEWEKAETELERFTEIS